ncbi:MAG: hypothetical protein ABIT04_01025 [Novosphingobium sp.]
MSSKEETTSGMAFELLKPSLFLARMLAREGGFPPQYLDGFQRLVDDALECLSSGQLSERDKDEVKREVLVIINDARKSAGLE